MKWVVERGSGTPPDVGYRLSNRGVERARDVVVEVDPAPLNENPIASFDRIDLGATVRFTFKPVWSEAPKVLTVRWRRMFGREGVWRTQL